MTDIMNYSYDVQKIYLELLLSDPESYARCENIFNYELFDRKLIPVAKYIKDYADENKVLPTYEIVNSHTSAKLIKHEDLKINHYEWLLNDFEQFVRHKSLEQAIIKSADHLEKGEYGVVEELIKKASEISLSRDIGIDYWTDPVTRLEKLKNSNGQISTGWQHLDEKLYGGFNRGEVEIFAGPSGSGKSLFLANIALNCAMAKLNVVYITHELSAELVALRMDAMTLGVGTREIYKNLDKVELTLGIQRKSAGDLRIKFIPSGTTVRDLSAYLKEYEIITNKKIDVMCHDYLDLLMPKSVKISASDLFVKDKYVTEELRNLAMEKNICIVSASQLNRSAIDEIEYDHSHIAGGISKINTVDNVFGIFTSRSMRERGKYQLQLLKTRNSSGVGSKVDLDFDVVSLKISDTEQQDESENVPVTSTPTSNRINILDAVKNRTNAQQENNVEERSGKLREFLQNLGDSEFVPG